MKIIVVARLLSKYSINVRRICLLKFPVGVITENLTNICDEKRKKTYSAEFSGIGIFTPGIRFSHLRRRFLSKNKGSRMKRSIEMAQKIIQNMLSIVMSYRKFINVQSLPFMLPSPIIRSLITFYSLQGSFLPSVRLEDLVANENEPETFGGDGGNFYGPMHHEFESYLVHYLA